MRQVKGVKLRRERPSMVRKILFGPNLISHWFLRWGHLVCHVHPWLRQLCRTIETLPPEIQRSYEGLFKKRTNHNMSFAFACFQGERQMEAELSNLGGEVMAGQQLQVWLPPTYQFPPSNYWPSLLTTLLVWYKTCVLLIWPCDLFCSFQALTASEGDVLLTYSNGQQFQL